MSWRTATVDWRARGRGFGVWAGLGCDSLEAVSVLVHGCATLMLVVFYTTHLVLPKQHYFPEQVSLPVLGTMAGDGVLLGGLQHHVVHVWARSTLALGVLIGILSVALCADCSCLY